MTASVSRPASSAASQTLCASSSLSLLSLEENGMDPVKWSVSSHSGGIMFNRTIAVTDISF